MVSTRLATIIQIQTDPDGAVSFLFDHYSLDKSEKPSMNCFRASFKRLNQKHKLDHLTVRFMKQIQDNIWVWPELDDLSLVPYSDIIKVCQCPDLVRHGTYQFID